DYHCAIGHSSGPYFF
nr:immunoglobulin light chain junction region [Macaca mulatta]